MHLKKICLGEHKWLCRAITFLYRPSGVP